jgi:CheY-like chemotaxis protein
MTGYSAAQAIRRAEESQGKARSIIIALTGCTADELQEGSETDVLDDFLEKPVSIENLRSSVLRALSLRARKMH